jgi:NHL repeat
VALCATLAALAIATLSCAAGDTIADLVAGQLTFTLNMPNFTDAAGLFFPAGIALDNGSSPAHLYVADQNNNRVLAWNDAESFVNGAAADLVIGQPDFVTVVPPVTGGRQVCAAASSADLCFPRGVAVDSHSNLYVADTSNNRVLIYSKPFINGTVADRVLGQNGSFTSNGCNRHLITAQSLCGPVRVALDASDRLYVSDFGNNRVLEYEAPLGGGNTANLVFGQAGSFTTGTCNKGGLGRGHAMRSDRRGD